MLFIVLSNITFNLLVAHMQMSTVKDTFVKYLLKFQTVSSYVFHAFCFLNRFQAVLDVVSDYSFAPIFFLILLGNVVLSQNLAKRQMCCDLQIRKCNMKRFFVFVLCYYY